MNDFIALMQIERQMQEQFQMEDDRQRPVAVERRRAIHAVRRGMSLMLRRLASAIEPGHPAAPAAPRHQAAR